MSKVGCLGCVIILDCSLPKYCGNRFLPDPKIRKKVHKYLLSSMKDQSSEVKPQ